jgi:hypothetical protein
VCVCVCVCVRKHSHPDMIYGRVKKIFVSNYTWRECCRARDHTRVGSGKTFLPVYCIRLFFSPVVWKITEKRGVFYPTLNFRIIFELNLLVSATFHSLLFYLWTKSFGLNDFCSYQAESCGFESNQLKKFSS